MGQEWGDFTLINNLGQIEQGSSRQFYYDTNKPETKYQNIKSKAQTLSNQIYSKLSTFKQNYVDGNSQTAFILAFIFLQVIIPLLKNSAINPFGLFTPLFSLFYFFRWIYSMFSG